MSGEAGVPGTRMYAWGLFSTPVYDENFHVQGCIPYPSSIELGRPIRTAQAFGVLLVMFMLSIFLGLLLTQFFLEHGSKSIYHIIKVLLPCAFFCQLLTFTSFASIFCSEIIDEEDEFKGTVPATCVPGGAGTVAMFNLVALIVMMIVMSMVVPPDHPVFQLYGTGNSVVRLDQQQTYRSRRDTTKSRSSSSSAKKKTQHQRQPIQQYSMVEPKRPGHETIKTTIIDGPNGRQTIKEITHPDGSQTITTTVEEIHPSTNGSGSDNEYNIHVTEDDDEDITSLGDESTFLEVI